MPSILTHIKVVSKTKLHPPHNCRTTTHSYSYRHTSCTMFTFKINTTSRAVPKVLAVWYSHPLLETKSFLFPMAHARITLVRFSFQAFVHIHPIEACITCREVGALSMTVRFYLKLRALMLCTWKGTHCTYRIPLDCELSRKRRRRRLRLGLRRQPASTHIS